jgi:hypothetical protein
MAEMASQALANNDKYGKIHKIVNNFNGDVRIYTLQKAKVLQSEFRRSTF